jgi:hypothetical protein
VAAAPTAPSAKTVKRLFALSGNRCAFPKCTTPLVLEGANVGEVCHIKAARPDGPRYDEAQSDLERHGFDNLLLLCGVHHTVVDDDETAYTVDRVTTMKRSHESKATPFSDREAAAGAALLSVNQSGGLAAGVINAQTIHVHAAAAPTAVEADSRARAVIGVFAPELARILAQQIHVLDRAMANFICSSCDQPLPNDHRSTFRPWRPALYPSAAEFRDLHGPDAALLVEFYDSLNRIEDSLKSWEDGEIPWDTNLWNVLMQMVEHSVRAGIVAADRFCPGRAYSPTVPAAGTLAERAATSTRNMQTALEAHIARFHERQHQQRPSPIPRR